MNIGYFLVEEEERRSERRPPPWRLRRPCASSWLRLTGR
jgi:hypothetical protein